MANLKEHVNLNTSAGGFLASRFSRHPERYIEIFQVLRNYKLHHVAAQLGMTHRHEDEDLIFDKHEEEDDHAADSKNSARASSSSANS